MKLADRFLRFKAEVVTELLFDKPQSGKRQVSARVDLWLDGVADDEVLGGQPQVSFRGSRAAIEHAIHTRVRALCGLSKTVR